MPSRVGPLAASALAASAWPAAAGTALPLSREPRDPARCCDRCGQPVCRCRHGERHVPADARSPFAPHRSSMTVVSRRTSGDATPEGASLLDGPALDKGTAFTEAEREARRLEGPLPPIVEALERQVERSRGDLSPSQAVYARAGLERTADLKAAVGAVESTVPVGVSTAGGRFEEVAKAMVGTCERPIVSPLSDPTDGAECTPEQAYTRTDGQALVACGVQLPGVAVGGKRFHPGQANASLVFPAVALAVCAARPERITGRMFIGAAKAGADQVRHDDRERGTLFPPRAETLEVEITTATRVAEAMFERCEATVERPRGVRAFIEALTDKPEYR